MSKTTTKKTEAKAPTSNAIVPARSAVSLTQTRNLEPNPSPAAILSNVDPDMPGAIVLSGPLPWNDYVHFEEGNKFAGELLTISKRYEIEEDEETGEKIKRARFTIVVRALGEVKCSRRWYNEEKSGEVKGELFKALGKTWDIYTVPAETLVGLSFRKSLEKVVPFARGAQAVALYVKINGLRPVASNPKKSYWDLTFGVAPLGFQRDASLDFLSVADVPLMDDGEEVAPFLERVGGGCVPFEQRRHNQARRRRKGPVLSTISISFPLGFPSRENVYMNEENWITVASFKNETARCHVTVYRDLSKGWARYRLEFGALYVKEGDVTRAIRYLSVRTKKTSAVTFTIVEPVADTMQRLVSQAELFIIEDIEKEETQRVINRDVKETSDSHRKTGKTQRERDKKRGRK